jgi:hypothetical protein
MSILDEADELRKNRSENPNLYPTPKESKSIPFEITRFFIALQRSLDSKHQLLPYMKSQIYNDVERSYLSISDEEVKAFLKS